MSVEEATNQFLEDEIEAGRFRDDLYYRLNVVPIYLPPLRERRDDIPALVRHFLEFYCEENRMETPDLPEAGLKRMKEYDWPGNVRELENCMERAVALARFDSVTIDDLPLKVREIRMPEVDGFDQCNMPSMNVVEERYITKVLKATRSNKTLAAKILGFDRRTLYRKLRNLNVSPAEAASQRGEAVLVE